MARRYADSGMAAVRGFQMGAQAAKDWKETSNKAELAEAMKEALTEEKKSKVEINQPDKENYTFDTESGKYLPSLSAVQRGVSESLSSIDPQYEEKVDRVDRQFATPADKRMAMMQTGIDFWTKKGETDKALELQDKLEQQSLRSLQVKGAERAERTAQQEENYNKSKIELAKQFTGNRFRLENEAAMTKYATELDSYQKAIKENPDNPALAGMEPKKPSLRVMTGMDSLHDATLMMQHDMEHGKVDPVRALQYQQLVGQVKKEVSAEAFKLLHAGDIQGAIKSFEAQGDLRVPQGATVEARQSVYEAGGQKIPTNELVIKLPNGHFQVINGLQGLDALDAADKFVTRAFQGSELGLKKQEVGIHGAASARAGEKWAIEKPILEASAEDSKSQRTARKGLIEAIDSGDPKKIETAKQKALAAGVKLEKPSMEYTTVIDQMGNRAIITDKDKGSARVIDLQSGATKDLSAPGAPANVSFASEAEAQRALKAGTIKPGDTVTIGGRPARIN